MTPPTPPPTPPPIGAGDPNKTRTDPVAITSMILGIFGLLSLCSPLFAVISIPAVVTGIVAINRIGSSDGQLTGKGLAVGGIATGGLSILATAVFVILYATHVIHPHTYQH